MRNTRPHSSWAATAGHEEGGHVVAADGHRIAWHADGSRSRTIVFVHGVNGSSESWRPQVEALRASHRVVTFDQRGHGDSDEWAAPGGLIETLGGDLADVLEQLDLTDVVLVGHSLGGIAILQFLVDHPDVSAARVSGAALVATTGTSHFVTETLRLPGAFARVERRLVDLVASAAPAVLRRLGASCTPKTLRNVFGALAGFHLHDRLADVPIPVRVICGTRDHVTPISLSRRLAELLPVADLRIIEGAGHCVNRTHSSALTGAVRSFAATLPTPLAPLAPAPAPAALPAAA